MTKPYGRHYWDEMLKSLPQYSTHEEQRYMRALKKCGVKVLKTSDRRYWAMRRLVAFDS